VDQFQRYLAARIGGVTRVENFEMTTMALKGKRNFEFRNTQRISELAIWLIAHEKGPYWKKFFYFFDLKGMISHNDNELVKAAVTKFQASNLRRPVAQSV
jgi:hypothetical protein